MRIVEAFILRDVSDDLVQKLEKMNIEYVSRIEGYPVTKQQYDELNGRSSARINDRNTGEVITTSSSVKIEDTGFEWKLTGKTYPHRTAIKELGGRFNDSDKSWRIPREDTSKDKILEKLQ
jgi:hypothetical protein